MGVPSFFRKLVEMDPSTHFWKKDINTAINGINDGVRINNLFIDFNSVIYNVIPEIDAALSAINYENSLIDGIINKLYEIINKIIKPNKMIYISIDGTPPRAKMTQQRSRRYKTLKERKFIEDTKIKYNVVIDTPKWDKNSISPGTIFMTKLSKLIIKNIQENKFSTKDGPIIVFNDDSIPGEGEHKILPSLKRLKGKNDVSVVYSPDADLIVLSILSGVEGVYMLREQNNEYEDKYMYLDINECKFKFNESVSVSINGEINRLLIDYSFLTFFCGNDLVTPISFFKVKENGIDILINVHKYIYTEINQFLVSENLTINYSFLIKLLEKLVDIEEDQMKKMQRKIHKIRQKNKILDELPDESWEIEIIRYTHEEYYSPLHPQHQIFNKLFDKIDYYDPDWNEQYNKHFFSGININDVCNEYLKSLNYCINYYHKETLSWSWYYPYRNSPSIKELLKYIINNNTLDNISDSIPNDTIWERGQPYTQFEHLMLILPRCSFKLLPKSLYPTKCILDQYYPTNFTLDVVAGHKFIHSEPILPELNIHKIKKAIYDAENIFSSSEKYRNTLKTKPYTYKS
jgi:5'-3' exonuclease